MKRKSALLARFAAVAHAPCKRPRATHASLVYAPTEASSMCQSPVPTEASAPPTSSLSTTTPPPAPQAKRATAPVAVTGASTGASSAAPRVCLVRPPVVPSAAPLADGSRADAAERGFYAAWGMGPRRRDDCNGSNNSSNAAAKGNVQRQPLHRRNPGPNPISVSLAVLRDLNPDEYVVAEKTDGVRYALLLCGDEAGRPMAVMIDRAGRKFEVAVRAAARFFGGTGTLLDGELAWERGAPQAMDGAPQVPRLTVGHLVGVAEDDAPEDSPERQDEGGGATTAASDNESTTATTAPPDTLVYWAFDAVCVAGVSQRDADYETRIELVQRLLQGRDADELIEAAPGANAHGLDFRPKPCVAARLVDSVWSGDAPRLRHGSDGLVLTPLRDPIRTGTHWRQFKWKCKHTFDLQLRGRRRDDGTWLWGLYYLEADWTVPTADALARVARPPPASHSTSTTVSAPSPVADARANAVTLAKTDGDPPVARYLNACEGIAYRRSDVARASLDRALAAAQRGRSRATAAATASASGAATTTAAATTDDAECLVVFVLQKDAALDALVERALETRPGTRRIKCVVECEGAFVAPPAGWVPPAHAPPGGVRLLRCAIERLRTDKTDPNVRYTVRQTILNIDESITYATVRAALCRPRGPLL
ncbi:mRNA capping enzyme, catalytic domain containing protein [Pandoravirus salinus]|uniref:mRNA capping enzyme, catalytic domain containing protein n=1 Tax=Pandoravirus salinus TaxID=1349410 RepID=S4W644_9VIRU|nr:Adenylation DNA ligase like superfamily domain [Pandoravirus salinus]AGO85885.2 mRNA capping enzyme, catalytic domain containing protein [Pandoravirus salinus]